MVGREVRAIVVPACALNINLNLHPGVRSRQSARVAQGLYSFGARKALPMLRAHSPSARNSRALFRLTSSCVPSCSSATKRPLAIARNDRTWSRLTIDVR